MHEQKRAPRLCRPDCICFDSADNQYAGAVLRTLTLCKYLIGMSTALSTHQLMKAGERVISQCLELQAQPDIILLTV